MTIRDAIKIGLERKGMTQSKLAEMLGIRRTSVSAWLKGKASPTAENMVEIIRILEIQKELGLLIENEQSDLEKQVQVLQAAVLELQHKVRKIENKR